jgi:hypothetical protein
MIHAVKPRLKTPVTAIKPIASKAPIVNMVSAHRYCVLVYYKPSPRCRRKRLG